MPDLGRGGWRPVPSLDTRSRTPQEVMGRARRASKNGTRRELLFELIVCEPGGVAATAFQAIRPIVVCRAIGRVSEGLQLLRLGIRTLRIEVRVAGRIRNNVGYRYSKVVVNLVCHFVARHK